MSYRYEHIPEEPHEPMIIWFTSEGEAQEWKQEYDQLQENNDANYIAWENFHSGRGNKEVGVQGYRDWLVDAINFKRKWGHQKWPEDLESLFWDIHEAIWEEDNEIDNEEQAASSVNFENPQG